MYVVQCLTIVQFVHTPQLGEVINEYALANMTETTIQFNVFNRKHLSNKAMLIILFIHKNQGVEEHQTRWIQA